MAKMTRAQRLEAAIAQVDQAKAEIEQLLDEMRDHFDSLPDNFQESTKGQVLADAIYAVDEVYIQLDDAISIAGAVVWS